VANKRLNLSVVTSVSVIVGVAVVIALALACAALYCARRTCGVDVNVVRRLQRHARRLLQLWDMFGMHHSYPNGSPVVVHKTEFGGCVSVLAVGTLAALGVALVVERSTSNSLVQVRPHHAFYLPGGVSLLGCSLCVVDVM